MELLWFVRGNVCSMVLDVTSSLTLHFLLRPQHLEIADWTPCRGVGGFVDVGSSCGGMFYDVCSSSVWLLGCHAVFRDDCQREYGMYISDAFLWTSNHVPASVGPPHYAVPLYYCILHVQHQFFSHLETPRPPIETSVAISCFMALQAILGLALPGG